MICIYCVTQGRPGLDSQKPGLQGLRGDKGSMGRSGFNGVPGPPGEKGQSIMPHNGLEFKVSLYTTFFRAS